jgi:hypothetical protein
VCAETSESTKVVCPHCVFGKCARAADEMLLGEVACTAAKRASETFCTIWATAHTHSNAFYNDNSVQVLLIIAASSEARRDRSQLTLMTSRGEKYNRDSSSPFTFAQTYVHTYL